MIIQERLITGTNRFYRKKVENKGVAIHWTANMNKGAGARAHYGYCNRKGYKHTNGKTYEDSSLKRKFVYGAAQYYVDDTDMMKYIPSNEFAPHLGSSKYKQMKYDLYGNNSPNYYADGIELCVNSDSDILQTLENGAWLAAKLLHDQKGTPKELLFRHHDITGKMCPAFMIDESTWKQYKGKSGIEYISFEDFRTMVQIYFDNEKIVKPLIVDEGFSTRENKIPNLKPATPVAQVKPELPPKPNQPTVDPVVTVPVKTTDKAKVKEVQAKLNQLKYTDHNGNKLVVDGVSGSKTEAAIRKFQFAMGFPKTSIWGSREDVAYAEIVRPYTLYRRMKTNRPYAVRYLQDCMDITIDGSFGPGTERAVKRYQISKGLQVDGYFGPSSWSTLI